MNVLIIGHNPFNKELPNGRTLLELFSGFEKSQLAEIFLHPDAPNFEVCNRYYRIVDPRDSCNRNYHNFICQVFRNGC